MEPFLMVLPSHSPFLQPFPITNSICFPTPEFCCFLSPFPMLFGGRMPFPKNTWIATEGAVVLPEEIGITMVFSYFYPIG